MNTPTSGAGGRSCAVSSEHRVRTREASTCPLECLSSTAPSHSALNLAGAHAAPPWVSSHRSSCEAAAATAGSSGAGWETSTRLPLLGPEMWGEMGGDWERWGEIPLLAWLARSPRGRGTLLPARCSQVGPRAGRRKTPRGRPDCGAASTSRGSGARSGRRARRRRTAPAVEITISGNLGHSRVLSGNLG